MMRNPSVPSMIGRLTIARCALPTPPPCTVEVSASTRPEKRLEVGLHGRVLHQAAHRVIAVESALRTVEHLNVRHVVRVDVGLERRIARGIARADRHAVDLDPDRRREVWRGADSADGEVDLAVAVVLHGDSRNLRQVVGQFDLVPLLERLAGDDRHRHRRLEQRLPALLRRDDDFLELHRGRVCLLRGGSRGDSARRPRAEAPSNSRAAAGGEPPRNSNRTIDRTFISRSPGSVID